MGGSFWKDKRVLVTGADGFVGSHLTERLIKLGASVSILVRGTSVSGTTRYSFKNLPQEAVERVESIVCCDIASADTIGLIVRAEPQIIFHLAAAAYVPFSFDHPLEVLAVNVLGTVYVLEAARRLRHLERLVCTSSSEIYGTALTKQIDESHPLNPTSPYAASKAAADRYCFSYSATYALPVAIIRPFNTYGPRHMYDVIPKFIRLALHNQPITIYGSGEQTRDFMYITDTVGAFLTMGASTKAAGHVVNFGTGQDVSINAISRLIKQIAKSSSEIIHVEARTAEVDRLCCDYRLARKLFGWEPRVGIEQGLRENIEWACQHWL
jgi:nucleoside-diphosphate-sugar epimerase